MYFAKHSDLWEMHISTFLSFKVVVFIVILTAFQKTHNFYKLGSFNHQFSIWKSFLDTNKVEFDCAFIIVSSGDLFKSMLLKYYSNKNLPTLTNTFE